VVSGDSAGGGLALGIALTLPGTANGAFRVAPQGVRGVVPPGDRPGRAPDTLAVSATGRMAGCILLSAWLDLTADWTAVPELVHRDVVLSPAWLEACARAYLPTGDQAHPMVSPLHADLAVLPPLFIQWGTDDLVAPDSERLAARAEAAGVDVTGSRWPGLWHDFTMQPDITTAAGKALDAAAGFLARVSVGGGSARY
jgi:acetyl esterase/lipase